MGSARGYRLKSKCTLRENYGLKHFNTILNIYRSCYRIRILNLPLVSVPRIVQLHNSFPINEASFFWWHIFVFTVQLDSIIVQLCVHPCDRKSQQGLNGDGEELLLLEGSRLICLILFEFRVGHAIVTKTGFNILPPGKKAKHNKIIFHAFSENLLTRILL